MATFASMLGNSSISSKDTERLSNGSSYYSATSGKCGSGTKGLFTFQSFAREHLPYT